MRPHPRARPPVAGIVALSAVLAGVLLVLPAVPAAQGATAAGLSVVPGSRGNVLHLTVAGAGPEARAGIEILARPAWLEGIEIARAEAESAEISVRFDVNPNAAVGQWGLLVIACAAGGPEARTATRRWLLHTAAEAPAEQIDTRIEECCLASSAIEIDGDGLPARHQLLGSDPNPCLGAMRVRFGLPPGGGPVSLRIHDLAGRRVRELRTSELPGGFHQLRWDGEDETGRPLPPGVYFYEIRSGAWTDRGRALLLR